MSMKSSSFNKTNKQKNRLKFSCLPVGAPSARFPGYTSSRSKRLIKAIIFKKKNCAVQAPKNIL